MERILVLGPCGAGKSTLALRLGKQLDLPVIHLDQHYWRPGWREPEPGDWAAQVEELIARPRWIMDGNYGGTLPIRLARADGAIFLDYPRRVFFSRMLWRSLSRFGRMRPDMAPGCAERLDWEFIRYTWRYRVDVLPRHLGRIEAAGVPMARLTNPAAAAAWLGAGATMPS
jgi:adenylate kinase family enzyme